MTRSYSDDSYGSEKTIQSELWSLGTRATALVELVAAPMSPIQVVDWNAINTVVGTGGPSTWVLAATSSLGTHAVGTFTFAGTQAVRAATEGSVVTTGTTHLCGAGGRLDLYSVLSTASPAPIVSFHINYKEFFVESDT